MNLKTIAKLYYFAAFSPKFYFSNLFYKLNYKKFLECIDFLLFVLVIFFIVNDIILIVSSLIENLIIFNSNCFIDLALNMSSQGNGVNTTSNTAAHSTHVTIVHNDGSWANGIRSLFIYGTGAFRLSLTRAVGSPSTRGFIIASTLAADGLTRVVNNTINDPSYVKSHIDNWKMIFNNNSDTDVNVTIDADTTSKLEKGLSPTSKFLGDGDSLSELSNNMISYLVDNLQSILKPVQVDYSNEVLANQVYDISILLFILSLLIMVLFISFMFNVILVINSDRIINYFKNKYIIWYVKLNKKLISIELIFLGGSILYFMYNLTVGIHFIATHPINLS